jgi:hypothetical protein
MVADHEIATFFLGHSALVVNAPTTAAVFLRIS